MAKLSSGLDQNLCVNRGVDQDNCFVARLLHIRTGRMLEIYSNQCGVGVSTANDFLPDATLPKPPPKLSLESSDIFHLIDTFHGQMANIFATDQKTNYAQMKGLIKKIHKRVITEEDKDEIRDSDIYVIDNDFTLDPIQVNYLEKMRDMALTTDVCESKKLAKIIQKILTTSVTPPLEETNEEVQKVSKTKEEILAERNKIKEEMHKKLLDEEMKRRGLIRMTNKPVKISNGPIIGKGGAVYGRHGAICLQTQNYPNAVAYENFPNCILRPGEVYKHKIVYKFWVRTGDSSKCNRRIDREFKKKNKQ